MHELSSYDPAPKLRARTIHMGIELARVPDFSWNLLTNFTRFIWEPTCNGYIPSLYINEGYG